MRTSKFKNVLCGSDLKVIFDPKKFFCLDMRAKRYLNSRWRLSIVGWFSR